MAKYIVIERFEDRDGKQYKKDEVYPRPANKKITKKRLEELTNNNNNVGRPFIRLEEEEKEEDKVEGE